MSARYPYYLLADSPEGIAKESELTGQLPSTQKTEADIKKGFIYKRVPHVTLKSIANNPDIKEGMTREKIDTAIARHTETEILYDQPYEDNKRIRVSGPFTVESLSPHRIISTDEERPVSEKEASKAIGAGQFETMILENLKKAGCRTLSRTNVLFLIAWSLSPVSTFMGKESMRKTGNLAGWPSVLGRNMGRLGQNW